MILKEKEYRAGIYLRLSKDEDDIGDSCSIISQRMILEQYCNENSIIIFKEYCDDGYSGTNFERPGFKEMVEDIKKKKINLIITKDLSRFGRDYIQSGYYIENVFDDYNIRYIAIEDKIDTLDNDNEINMPLKNLFNDIYAREISKTTKSSLDARAKEGLYLASRPPFGYIKSSENKHLLIIDREAAKIVEFIFSLAADGNGLGKITKALNNKNIATPSAYYALKNPKQSINIKRSAEWSISSVKSILENKTYLGMIIHGKTRVKSIYNKKRIKQSKEDWIISENKHDAIVSLQLWNKAHKSLQSRKRTSSNKNHHIFAGLIRCSDCDTAMTFRKREFQGKLNGEFICGKYNVYGKEVCSTHYITFEKIYKYVLNDINNKAIMASENKERLRDELLNSNEKWSIINEIKNKDEIKFLKHKIESINKIIENAFEDKVFGRITEEQFSTMYNEYEADCTEYKEKLAIINEAQTQQKIILDNVDAFISIISQYKSIDALTASLLNELIENIYVGKTKNSDASIDQQKIIINYKLIPTP